MWVFARSLFAGVLVAGLSLAPSEGRAATAVSSTPFNFAHNAEVTTGLVVLLGYYQSPGTASSTVTLPQFDPALGRLTKVTVLVKTTSTTFVVTPTGVLSLISAAQATRKLSYAYTLGVTTGSGSNEVVSSGGTLLTLLGGGGGDIAGAPLTSSTDFTAQADLQRFTGTGTFSTTLTADDKLEIFTVLSVLYGAGLKGAGNYTGSVSVTYEYTPWALSGFVYKDVDHDGFRSAGEATTGLALYAKLLSGPSGPVLQTTPLDPTTGFYAFAAARGSYRIVIDDNASASDVTPLQLPAGWSATQGIGMARDVTLAGDVPNQDFGLLQATSIAGRLFADTGTGGGGVANDGVANGSEPGWPGKTVQLLNAGGTVLDTAVSAADGTFRLFVPSSVSNGAVLRVRQAAEDTSIATGGSAGTTGGSYVRADPGISFTLASSTGYSGVALGSVAVPSLTPSQTAVGAPGTTLLFNHTYRSPTAGTVTFSTTHASATGAVWGDAVYLDTNGNGVLDPGEPVATGAVNVVAGQAVSVIVKVTVPAGTASNVRLATALKADLVLTNAAPALSQSTTVSDYTIVLPTVAASLALTKAVNLSTAAPGATLVYTITFTNPGTTPVRNLVIADVTPVYTTYLSSSVVSVPAALGTASVAVPSVGASGPVQWQFSGELAPNASGSVQFSVLLAY